MNLLTRQRPCERNWQLHIAADRGVAKIVDANQNRIRQARIGDDTNRIDTIWNTRVDADFESDRVTGCLLYDLAKPKRSVQPWIVGQQIPLNCDRFVASNLQPSL